MRRNLAFGLLLVALLALVRTFVWKPAGRSHPPEREGVRVGELSPPAAVPLGAAGPAAPDVSTTAVRAPAPDRVGAAAEVAAPAVLRGRVALPERTPADERAEVVLEVPPRRSTDPGENAYARWGEWIERGRTAIASDGSFSLALPLDVPYARARVQGRYLLMQEAEKVENLSDPAPLMLEPQLGANVTFVLVPPPGGTYDPRQLVGRKVELEHITRGVTWIGSPRWTQFEIAEDLSFGGRALAVSDTYDVADRRARDEAEVPTGLVPFVAGEWDDHFVAGASMRVEIPLLEGLTVAGHAVDERGAALAGVSIQAECRYEQGATYWYAETGADGSFQLRGIPPGLQRLNATKDGYGPVSLEGEALGMGLDRTGLELVLSTGLGIRGVLVLPDGTLVQGATVKVWPSSDELLSTANRADTDEQGAFAITGLTRGEHVLEVEVTLPHYEPGAQRVQAGDRRTQGTAWFARLEGVAAGSQALRVELATKPLLRGRVIDSTGDPLSSFQLVAAQADGRWPRMPDIDATFFSDREHDFESADGRFAWGELSPGEWYVAAQADGYPKGEAQRVRVGADEAELELVLARGASIAGRVELSGDGEASKVVVSATRITPGLRSGGPTARSDEVGRFRLDGLMAGRYELSAREGEWLTPTPATVEVGEGEAREDVLLGLVRGGYLACEVLSPEGEPIVEARIEVQAHSRGLDQSGAITDASGLAELGPLPPGEVLLNAYALDSATNRYRTLSAPAFVVSGERTEVRIGADAPRLTLRGRVSVVGQPLVRCGVDVYTEAGAHAGTTTDAQGRYELGLSIGGVADIVLTPEDERSSMLFTRSLPQAGASEASFELPSSGIRGRVQLPDDEQARFWLVVVTEREEAAPTPEGQRTRQGRLAADGSFAMLHLEPGTYQLCVRSRLPGRSAQLDQDAPAPVRVVVPEAQIVEGLVLVAPGAEGH